MLRSTRIGSCRRQRASTTAPPRLHNALNHTAHRVREERPGGSALRPGRSARKVRATIEAAPALPFSLRPTAAQRRAGGTHLGFRLGRAPCGARGGARCPEGRATRGVRLLQRRGSRACAGRTMYAGGGAAQSDFTACTWRSKHRWARAERLLQARVRQPRAQPPGLPAASTWRRSRRTACQRQGPTRAAGRRQAAAWARPISAALQPRASPAVASAITAWATQAGWMPRGAGAPSAPEGHGAGAPSSLRRFMLPFRSHASER